MNLIDKLPSFYANDIDTVIQNSLSLEANTLHNEVQNTLDQLFLDSCTWGLDYWEYMLCISKNNHDIQTRRENIKAKMRSRGTTTLNVIKSICKAYSNGEVEIIENYNDYSFVIKFVGAKGIPAALNELDKTIEEIKPCHLAHSYEFTYLTWDEFDNFNYTFDEWDNLNLTWDEFEVYRKDGVVHAKRK